MSESVFVDRQNLGCSSSVSVYHQNVLNIWSSCCWLCVWSSCIIIRSVISLPCRGKVPHSLLQLVLHHRHQLLHLVLHMALWLTQWVTSLLLFISQHYCYMKAHIRTVGQVRGTRVRTLIARTTGHENQFKRPSCSRFATPALIGNTFKAILGVLSTDVLCLCVLTTDVLCLCVLTTDVFFCLYVAYN